MSYGLESTHRPPIYEFRETTPILSKFFFLPWHDIVLARFMTTDPPPAMRWA